MPGSYTPPQLAGGGGGTFDVGAEVDRSGAGLTSNTEIHPADPTRAGIATITFTNSGGSTANVAIGSWNGNMSKSFPLAAGALITLDYHFAIGETYLFSTDGATVTQYIERSLAVA